MASYNFDQIAFVDVGKIQSGKIPVDIKWNNGAIHLSNVMVHWISSDGSTVEGGVHYPGTITIYPPAYLKTDVQYSVVVFFETNSGDKSQVISNYSYYPIPYVPTFGELAQVDPYNQKTDIQIPVVITAITAQWEYRVRWMPRGPGETTDISPIDHLSGWKTFSYAETGNTEMCWSQTNLECGTSHYIGIDYRPRGSTDSDPFDTVVSYGTYDTKEGYLFSDLATVDVNDITETSIPVMVNVINQAWSYRITWDNIADPSDKIVGGWWPCSGRYVGSTFYIYPNRNLTKDETYVIYLDYEDENGVIRTVVSDTSYKAALYTPEYWFNQLASINTSTVKYNSIPVYVTVIQGGPSSYVVVWSRSDEDGSVEVKSAPFDCTKHNVGYSEYIYPSENLIPETMYRIYIEFTMPNGGVGKTVDYFNIDTPKTGVPEGWTPVVAKMWNNSTWVPLDTKYYSSSTSTGSSVTVGIWLQT